MVKQEPKDKILGKSKELFERYGYNKTTLTDIAKSIGKVKTAIYYYFSGKDEIFAQLVRIESETFFKKLIQATNQYKDPIEKLEKYVDTRIVLMKKLSTNYSFLKEEFCELMPIVEENRKETDKLEIIYVNKIMEEIKKSGKSNFNSAENAARILVKTLKGLEVQMYVTDQLQIEESGIEEFRNFILYGLLNKN